jgi:hypothetical protein
MRFRLEESLMEIKRVANSGTDADAAVAFGPRARGVAAPHPDGLEA